jgi:ATP-binding cassette subfamily C (CFTR/MRP) protein 4
LGNPLTADKVFSSLALFNVVKSTMGTFFPQAMEKMAECSVSATRIVAFLQLPEVNDMLDKQANSESRPIDDDVAVSFDQANFTWATSSAAAMEALLDSKRKKQNAQPAKSEAVAQTDVKDQPGNKESQSQEDALLNMKQPTEKPTPERLVLKNITLQLMKNELLVVVGPVGRYV